MRANKAIKVASPGQPQLEASRVQPSLQVQGAKHIRKQLFILVAILVWGAVLRFWNIWYLLPYNHVSDEQYVVNGALWLSKGATPEAVGWPATTFFFLVAFFYMIFFGLGQVLGIFHGTLDFMLAYVQDPTIWYLIPRCLSALAGVITILLVFVLGKRMFGANVGLLAAFFLAVSPLHASASQLAMPDVPMTMMVVLGLLCCHRILTRGHMIDYVLAGATAGLATATKFNAGLLIIPLLTAHVLTARQSGFWTLAKDGRLWAAGASYAMALYMGFPYIVTNPRTAVGSILSTPLGQAANGQLGAETLQLGWVYLATQILPEGLGLMVAALGAIGFLYVLLRRNPSSILILSFVLPYFLLLGRSRAIFERYAIPIVPLVALLAALVLERLIARLKANASVRMPPVLAQGHGQSAGLLRSRPGLWNLATVVLAVGVAVPSISSEVQHNSAEARTDTRYQARQWAHEHIPAGSSIAIEDYGPYLLPSTESLVREQRWWQEGFNQMREVIVKGEAANAPRYTMLVSGEPRFDIVYVGVTVDDPNEQIYRYNPEWVVISSDTYERYMEEVSAQRYPRVVQARRQFYRTLESDFVLIKVFEPDGSNVSGPVIKIYRRNGQGAGLVTAPTGQSEKTRGGGQVFP